MQNAVMLILESQPNPLFYLSHFVVTSHFCADSHKAEHHVLWTQSNVMACDNCSTLELEFCTSLTLLLTVLKPIIVQCDF